jgi:ABC-type polar amino acid transport system ATPase subunit
LNFAKEVADRIVFFDGGQIVEESKPDEFFKSPQTERARKFLEKLLK